MLLPVMCTQTNTNQRATPRLNKIRSKFRLINWSKYTVVYSTDYIWDRNNTTPRFDLWFLIHTWQFTAIVYIFIILLGIIDFSILMDYARTVSLNMSTSQRTPDTIQKYRKLIDLVMRMQKTRAILMPRFSNFLRNLIIHFLLCLYLVTCFLRVRVSLLCWSQGRTISSSFTNYIGINWNMYLWYSL